MPVTLTARGVVAPPVSRIVEPVTARSSRAVVGASAISFGVAGMRPAVRTTGSRLPATGS